MTISIGRDLSDDEFNALREKLRKRLERLTGKPVTTEMIDEQLINIIRDYGNDPSKWPDFLGE